MPQCRITPAPMSNSSDRGRKIIFVLGWSVLLALLSSIGLFVAVATETTSGMHWTGSQLMSPVDMPVYLNYIGQIKGGNRLTENFFTTEIASPTFNVLWYTVGIVS